MASPGKAGMSQSAGRSVLRVAAAAAVALIAWPALAGAEPPAPGAYQDDDGLGFRNILPPGSDGVASTAEVSAFLFGGARPAHNNDQLDEYDDLVQASPTIAPPGVDTFFKDASFGVPPADVGETYTPDCAETTAPAPSSAHCDELIIVRDSTWGVPHIYANDRAAAMFAAGYVGAEDRLFFMDVERHFGRAELSSFLGGSNISTDRSTWRAAPYTEADLQAQFDDLDTFRGLEGAQVKTDVLNYVDGVNQYIGEARAGNPDSPLPGEYAIAIGKPAGPDPWEVTDVVATASLVAGQFGKGGGGEVRSALVLEKAVERFGPADGRAAWEDLRSRDDDEAPTTVDGTAFPYGEPPANPDDVALPDPGTTVSEPVTVPPAPKVKAAQPPAFKQLLDLDGASNALLVSAAESEGDGPLAVFGPQVGYFSPQILTELDIHAPTTAEGPGIDARGVGFAGINMYVLLGRGTDYAWSATSAGQDIADTYALELCDPASPGDPGMLDDTGYRFEGACEPFEVLDRDNEWTPNNADSTPAGTETLRSLRTKAGIVTHRAEIGGIPHVFTQLRATYMHEADSAVGFADFNQPSTMESAAEFVDAAEKIDYTFNWFYADQDDIAYFNSGANPVRPATVDPNLPVDLDPGASTLDNMWSNFNPDDVTFDRAPDAERPQVTNQDYISSWNNKQAPAYSAADDQFSWGSVQRVDSLNERIEAGIEGADEISREELVDAMEDSATVDLRGSQVIPIVLKGLKEGDKSNLSRPAKKARKTLREWTKSGAHRRDLDEDGKYEDRKAVKIMDALWPRLVRSMFKPEMGLDLYEQAQGVVGLHNRPGAGGSAFNSGWYGYVEKDLRAVLGDPVIEPYSRMYCGGGDGGECGNAIARALTRAMKHRSNDELYPGHPTTACQNLPTSPNAQWCNDSIRATAIGAITQPPIDWQNRPTFQQVVEPQNQVPFVP